ncbi:MAG: SDR family oxidoreductase [Bryobacterales bacterium]
MPKVAFITGASRGIGLACAHRLARAGWDVVIAAKTVDPHPKLPGTIFTAAQALREHGREVLPLRCDVRNLEEVDTAAKATLDKFGRVDAIINNAGALWWKRMDEVPMKRYDLVNEVNSRGAYAVTFAFLEHLKRQRFGHIINMSPPLNTRMIPGRIAYAISKLGMTMQAIGIAHEFRDFNIRATALWPATTIETSASINFNMGERSQWRKPEIVADATYEVLQNPEKSNGKALIDEPFLRELGYTDFDRYACVPGSEPRPIAWTSAER